MIQARDALCFPATLPVEMRKKSRRGGPGRKCIRVKAPLGPFNLAGVGSFRLVTGGTGEHSAPDGG